MRRTNRQLLALCFAVVGFWPLAWAQSLPAPTPLWNDRNPILPETPGSLPTPINQVRYAPTNDAKQPAVTGAPVDPATDIGPGRDAANPSGRQEPAVSVEWMGPSAVNVGQKGDYSIIVRNTSVAPVQQVLVRVRLLGSVTAIGSDPRAIAEDNVLSWDVGTLMPRQERTIRVQLVSNARGDVAAQAWVTFTGLSAMRVKVREPRIALKAVAPPSSLIGDTCTYMMTVNNPGDCPIEHVRLHVNLSDRLSHPNGNSLDYDLGTLAPGEARSVNIVCLPKNSGEHWCEGTVEADGGLRATDRVSAVVMMPRLDLEAKGPKLRYLDRRAIYTFKVTNPGDAPASNVTVTDLLPEGFKFVNADQGGKHDFATRTVSWNFGEIPAGQSREMSLEVICAREGEYSHKISAQASRGLRVDAEALTRVEGISALHLEMVDLTDPVEVGAETVYEIRITNTGSKTESDLKLVCTVPFDKMDFKSATGPTGFAMVANEVVFDPLVSLAPRSQAVYRVTVKCTAPGIAHFKSRLTSAILSEPVSKVEATRIYTD